MAKNEIEWLYTQAKAHVKFFLTPVLRPGLETSLTLDFSEA